MCDLTFHRLAATDARTLPDAERDRYYNAALNRIAYHKPLLPGEIACYISHLRAWQLILERDWDYAVILEDDVQLTARFSGALAQLTHLPLDWDVIKLGSSSTKRIIAQTTLPAGFSLCAYSKVPICNHAQAVSRRGAAKLLASSIPFARPVDVDLQHPWETGIDVYGLEPFCTYVTDAAPSDIWGSLVRNTRPKRHWRSLVNRMRFAALALIYNSKRHGFAITAKTMLFGGLPHP